MDMCGSRELVLEEIIVVRLGTDDNDLWQRSGDGEEVHGFPKGNQHTGDYLFGRQGRRRSE